MNFIKCFTICSLIVLVSCKYNIKKKPFTTGSFKTHILNLKPTQRKGISKKEFKLGKTRFQSTLNRIIKNSYRITSNDFWDLTLAQISLGEPVENIRYTYFKAYELDPNKICFILQFQEQEAIEGFQRMLKIIPELQDIVDTCQTAEYLIKDGVCPTNYSKKNNLDSQLVAIFQRMDLTDQKYRVSLDIYEKHKTQQDIIDKKNQQTIDSLFSIYKEYIGETYVGNNFDHVMWLIVQHSNIDMMKRYLPIIHQAVIEKELPKGPLKMLIDRIYNIEYGYQIFGSQVGVDLADDEIRKKVIAEYDMDNL